jgi:hypothetical protein
MSDDRWKTTFEIKHTIIDATMDDDPISFKKHMWQVVNTHNGVVVGTYRDSSYAVKQARRKYKKLVRLMEKTFMSLA